MAQIDILRALIKEVVKQQLQDAGGFSLPPKIRANYQITNSFKDAESWKAKVILANNAPEEKKGTWDRTRYVLISLDSNMIVPIAMADEHRVGYDLLWHLIDNKKVPHENFVSIDSIGTTYIYHESDILKLIKAASKFLAWGGNKNLIVVGPDNVRTTIEELCKVGIKAFIKAPAIPGVLNKLGRRLIDGLEEVAVAYKAFTTKKGFKAAAEKRFINIAESFLQNNIHILNDINYGAAQRIAKQANWDDSDAVVELFFAYNGIENIIHIALKQAVESKGHVPPALVSIFGDLKKALQEFDRLASI